jgi:hypothetical protein
MECPACGANDEIETVEAEPSMSQCSPGGYYNKCCCGHVGELHRTRAAAKREWSEYNG